MIFKKKEFRSIRKSKKLKITDLAREAGIHRVTLSNWESGKRIPSEQKVRLLARILKISVSKISNLEDEYQRSDKSLTEMWKSWHAFVELEKSSFDSCIKQLQNYYREYKNSSILFNSLISVINDIFYVKDTDQKYITVNSAFLNNVGLDINFNTLGKDDTNFFSLNESKINTEEDTEVLHLGKEIIREGYIPGSRKKKWGIIKKTPIFDINNRIAGLIGTFIDISERNEREKERSLLHSVINNSDEMFWIGTLNKKYDNMIDYIFISDAVNKIFGVSKEDFNDLNWEKHLHKDFKHLFDIPIGRINTNKFPLEYEYKFIQSNGKIKQLYEKIFRNGDMFFGTVRDVTVLNEKQLLNEMLISGINKTLDYYVWIIDCSGKKQKIIPSGTEQKIPDIYGYSIEEFSMQQSDFIEDIVLPEDIDKLKQMFSKGPYPRTVIYKIKDKTGNIRQIQNHIIKSESNDNGLFLILSKKLED